MDSRVPEVVQNVLAVRPNLQWFIAGSSIIQHLDREHVRLYPSTLLRTLPKNSLESQRAGVPGTVIPASSDASESEIRLDSQ